MFSEDNLLKLLQVQSNITPNCFAELYGEDKGRRLFSLFARDSWNLLSFLYNKVNGDDRAQLLELINSRIADNG